MSPYFSVIIGRYIPIVGDIQLGIQLNREIKAYCPDFKPVRGLLRGLEAAFIEVKHQTDFYYHLPPDVNVDGTRRLKLRVEEEKAEVIYYYDRQENGARTSHFQLWEATDAPVREILDAALGVRVIVHKQRELWRKDNVVFNLDTVEDVGQVFEVEAQPRDNWDPDQQVLECRRLFGPYLGEDIVGSNEDLVPHVPPRCF